MRKNLNITIIMILVIFFITVIIFVSLLYNKNLLFKSYSEYFNHINNCKYKGQVEIVEKLI